MAISEMGALRITNHKEWKRRIKAALQKSGGKISGVGGAAEILGVKERRVVSWFADPANELDDLKRRLRGENDGTVAAHKAANRRGA